MRFHRLDADAQPVGYFLVDAAFRNLLDHLALAVREAAARGLGPAFQELVEERVRDRAREVRAVNGKRIQRRNQMLLGVRFEDQALHTRPQEIHDDLFAVVHGVEQDFDPWKFAFQRMRQIQSVQFGDRIIEDRDVRAALPRKRQRRATIGSLGDNLVVWLGLEKLTDPTPHGVVIINDQDPFDRRRHAPPARSQPTLRNRVDPLI